MSQEQPRRHQQQRPIKYGDVFNVSGDLASKAIPPVDADMMQTAETMVFGETQKGGPAAMMQSAASRNERSGFVGHDDVTDAARDQGVAVKETDVPGIRVITEKVAGQVVGQFVEPTPFIGAAIVEQNAITIGQALEATAHTAGDKPVDESDAAAIQAAEVRATGSNVVIPGGLAASAQSAAAFNAGVIKDEDKIKLKDIQIDAAMRLPADKVVTKQDAEGVMSAELRNKARVAAHPGGVAESMAEAARMNENVRHQ
ncbi:late embryogenesis abundant protein D-34-like [Cucurbita maxima]|uniref:Late embryogenesis abundant protein D-34-like n=1 Tax=Cucurbita maxima TaxID=3661 RepID=A0A6J1KC62_CUCMA|nr:late embryogenesis abundant protein D-34-like [Cucurbita maxima]